MNWIKLPSGTVINLEHVMSLYVKESPATPGSRAYTLYTVYGSGHRIELDKQDYDALAAHIDGMATIVEAK